MLIQYTAYNTEISDFVTELKTLKNIRYSAANKAYMISFDDDTKIYVPKEFDTYESIIEPVTEEQSSEYYKITRNKICLYDLQDEIEAQLVLNRYLVKELNHNEESEFLIDRDIIVSYKALASTVNDLLVNKSAQEEELLNIAANMNYYEKAGTIITELIGIDMKDNEKVQYLVKLVKDKEIK